MNNIVHFLVNEYLIAEYNSIVANNKIEIKTEVTTPKTCVIFTEGIVFKPPANNFLISRFCSLKQQYFKDVSKYCNNGILPDLFIKTDPKTYYYKNLQFRNQKHKIERYLLTYTMLNLIKKAHIITFLKKINKDIYL